MNKLPGWYQRVYRVSQFPESEREYWKRVRDYVIERDGLRCQACYKRGTRKKLTVHHIIPRAEGGDEELDNLISLHYSCHDYVEAKGFRAVNEIIGCTRHLEKGELLEAALDRDIPPKPEPEDVFIPDDDREEIVCVCGIYHIRKKSSITGRAVTIPCACGLVGVYQDGRCDWKPKFTQAPRREIKPAKKRKGTNEHTARRKLLQNSPDAVRCISCGKILIKPNPQPLTALICECGAKAMYGAGGDGWIWFELLMPSRKLIMG